MKTIAFALVARPDGRLRAGCGRGPAIVRSRPVPAGRSSRPTPGSPEALYTAAQSHQKLGRLGRSARAPTPGSPSAPRTIRGTSSALSGQQLLDDHTDAALESAQQAVQMAGDLAEAHYQLGLVLAKRQDWRGAAEAFDRAVRAEPGERLRALLRRADAVPRGPARSHGEPLRAVPEARARSAGAARSAADHEDGSRTVTKLTRRQLPIPKPLGVGVESWALF